MCRVMCNELTGLSISTVILDPAATEAPSLGNPIEMPWEMAEPIRREEMRDERANFILELGRGL